MQQKPLLSHQLYWRCLHLSTNALFPDILTRFYSVSWQTSSFKACSKRRETLGNWASPKRTIHCSNNPIWQDAWRIIFSASLLVLHALDKIAEAHCGAESPHFGLLWKWRWQLIYHRQSLLASELERSITSGITKAGGRINKWVEAATHGLESLI